MLNFALSKNKDRKSLYRVLGDRAAKNFGENAYENIDNKKNVWYNFNVIMKYDKPRAERKGTGRRTGRRKYQ